MSSRTVQSHLPRLLAVLVVAGACASAAATPIVDPTGDFLPTYIGVEGGDLDVLSADVTLVSGTTFHFFAQVNGLVGATANAFFVWGLDRGAGTQRFVTGTPSVGAGVFFDSVIAITPTANNTGPATGAITLFGAPNTVIAITTPISIVGDTIAFDLAASLFPSQGRALADYGWNLWPRDGAGNAHISDFAPDAATPRVDVVPIAPTPWLLTLGAVGALVASRRRRA